MKLDWLLIFDLWVIVMTHGYEFFLVHLKSLLAGPTRILYLSRNSCWWPISDHGLVHTLGSSLLIPPTQLRIIPNVSFTPLNSIYALSLFQINYTNKLFSSKKHTCNLILLCRVYIRGDSMIWDFKGHRPLSAKEHVVSIKDGPLLWNKMSKVWRVHVWRN